MRIRFLYFNIAFITFIYKETDVCFYKIFVNVHSKRRLNVWTGYEIFQLNKSYEIKFLY